MPMIQIPLSSARDASKEELAVIHQQQVTLEIQIAKAKVKHEEDELGSLKAISARMKSGKSASQKVQGVEEWNK